MIPEMADIAIAFLCKKPENLCFEKPTAHRKVNTRKTNACAALSNCSNFQNDISGKVLPGSPHSTPTISVQQIGIRYCFDMS